jgi:hypothetical protein
LSEEPYLSDTAKRKISGGVTELQCGELKGNLESIAVTLLGVEVCPFIPLFL